MKPLITNKPPSPSSIGWERAGVKALLFRASSLALALSLLCGNLLAALPRYNLALQDQAEEEFQKPKAQALNTEVEAQKTEANPAVQVFGSSGGGGLGGGGGAFVDRLQNVIHRASGKTLVISSSEPDLKEQAELQEDLTVMSHLLDKTVAEELGVEKGPDRVLGINVYFASGPGSLNNLYLEGYGAVFMLNVAFPLLAPPAKVEGEKEKPPVDSAWEEAREELYGGHHDEKPASAAFPEYDEAKVVKLKETLIRALKNGANIRNLKPDESITICVFGGGSVRFHKVATSRPGTSSAWAGNSSSEGATRLWDVRSGKLMSGPAQGSTMTIRVKKSDADAFGKGKLTVEEFRKKAKIATYASAMNGSGGNGGWFGENNPLGGFSYGFTR